MKDLKIKNFDGTETDFTVSQILVDCILFGLDRMDALSQHLTKELSKKEIEDFTIEEQNLILKKMKVLYKIEVIASFVQLTNFQEL
jgi:hypothetical protein